MNVRFVLVVAGLLGLAGCTEGGTGDPVGEVSPSPSIELDHRLVIKLVSSSDPGSAGEGRLQIDTSVVEQELTEILAREGASYVPMLPGVNEMFEQRHDLTPEFDFDSVMATDVLDYDVLLDLADEIRQLPGVEFAFLEPLAVPPPADITPPSSDFTSLQGYRSPGTNGVGATYAASIGLTGAGVRISDCEYGWNLAHEDLVDQGVIPEPGQTSPSWVVSNGWDSHGTAVLGELGATDNSYGVTGIAPGATLAVYPEWSNESGSRRSQSIAEAIADSVAGDVVVLEMQTTGANGGYGPAEYNLVVWNVVKAGTDAGVIVVAAAGNGDEDLDSSGYATYAARGDSGAIIVGAGQSGSRTKMGFSTYGSRVDVHGWGTSVTTTGYGNLATFGGDKNQRYTSSFSGTSSATPIVAGAVALLQEYAQTTHGVTLTPHQMRQILIDTGTPQSDPSNGEIGPLPHIEDAIAEIDAQFGTACPWSPGDWNYCRDCGPCEDGEGDCEPGECAPGLVCATDVGASYGWSSTVDVCEVPASGTKIEVRLRGVGGSERIRLQLDGQTVATFDNINTSWTTYRYDHGSSVNWASVRVRFDNDGSGKDAFVDWVELDDVRREAEDQAVNTGTWQNGSCGGSYSQALYCNGYIQF